MVEALLVAGTDVAVRTDEGETPLHQAAARNENPAEIEAPPRFNEARSASVTVSPAGTCGRTPALVPRFVSLAAVVGCTHCVRVRVAVHL